MGRPCPSALLLPELPSAVCVCSTGVLVGDHTETLTVRSLSIYFLYASICYLGRIHTLPSCQQRKSWWCCSCCRIALRSGSASRKLADQVQGLYMHVFTGHMVGLSSINARRAVPALVLPPLALSTRMCTVPHSQAEVRADGTPRGWLACSRFDPHAGELEYHLTRSMYATSDTHEHVLLQPPPGSQYGRFIMKQCHRRHLHHTDRFPQRQHDPNNDIHQGRELLPQRPREDERSVTDHRHNAPFLQVTPDSSCSPPSRPQPGLGLAWHLPELPRPPRCSPAHQQGDPHSADLDGQAPPGFCIVTPSALLRCHPAGRAHLELPEGWFSTLDPGSRIPESRPFSRQAVRRLPLPHAATSSAWQSAMGSWTQCRIDPSEKRHPGCVSEPSICRLLACRLHKSMKTPRAGRVCEGTDKGTGFVLTIYLQAPLYYTMHGAI